MKIRGFQGGWKRILTLLSISASSIYLIYALTILIPDYNEYRYMKSKYNEHSFIANQTPNTQHLVIGVIMTITGTIVFFLLPYLIAITVRWIREGFNNKT